MMMSDLPQDLVEEILSRVPATSLKRLRSTCKQWNALFKDQRFSEKHFRKAAKESLILMSKEYRVFSMSVNLNVAPPSIEFKGSLGLNDSHSNSEQVDIAEAFHCDGLLLCTTKDNRLVVWNPCLGETRWIQLKTGCMSAMKYSKFALGYQNNKYCRAYKILWSSNGNDYDTHKRVVEFEIYELSSNSWRVLNDVNPSFILACGGVSLKRNTYWLAVDKTDPCLISFDFTTEKFKHLCLPLLEDVGMMVLSVVKEEQLSVLHRTMSTSKMEIWVTNKIDAEAGLLWSKSFTVDLPIGSNRFHVYSSLLVDKEKKLALCSNLSFETSWNMVYTIGVDDEYFTEIPYIESTNNPWWRDNPFEESKIKLWYPRIFNYVPSLVHI